MNLKIFKVKKGLNNRQLADILNITTTHLSLLINGTRRPSNNLIARIIKLTNGEVDANSFFEKELKKAKNDKKNFDITKYQF